MQLTFILKDNHYDCIKSLEDDIYSILDILLHAACTVMINDRRWYGNHQEDTKLILFLIHKNSTVLLGENYCKRPSGL